MFDTRTKNNALSAYMLVWVCATFLFVKNNEYIDNDFVKSHTKTALLLQLFLVVTWFLFLHLSILSGFVFLNYGLNEIISIILFLFTFAFMLYGMYKAGKWEYFTIRDFGSMTKTENLVEVAENVEMNEKEKMTLILAHIPFIWFLVYGKYYNYRNQLLDNIIKLNSYSSFLIILIYILGYSNIASVFVLFYILFVVFSSIQIVMKWNILNFNLRYLKDTLSYFVFFKSFFIYLKRYFTAFQKFSVIELETRLKEEQRAKDNIAILSTKNDTKIPSFLIYIPIINIMFCFIKNSKYINHIKNGLAITSLFILILLLNYFYLVSLNWLLLLLFPIFFWIAYLPRLDYRLAFLNDAYELLESIIFFILELLHIAKSKHNEENEMSFKVSDYKEYQKQEEIE